MARVPEHVRADVVKRVYADAARIGWPTLAQEEKGRWYDRWTTDTDVGGRLTGYIRDDRIRVWLKDGPLKAYSHATAGVGPYAKYAQEQGATPSKAVLAAFGQDWRMEPDTIETEPLRVIATTESGKERRQLIYGPEKSFKELLWAGVVAATTEDIPVTILVLENYGAVSRPERAWQERLAKRCRLEITWASA